MTHPSTNSGQAHQEQNVRFGFWLYLMSDVVLFAGLFATYAVLRNATFGGAAPADLLDLPFVLVQTLLLLTSSFTVGLALIFAAKNEKNARSGPLGQVLPIFFALAATLLLGLGFLGMELYEFWHLAAQGEGPVHSASLSAFFALVGTHGLHVAFGALWMLVVMTHLVVRGLVPATVRKLWILALFWHFLDIVWIFIFSFVYLFGALL